MPMTNKVVRKDESNITLYSVHADCLDEQGNVVDRHIGIVRGMTDNGQPGWTKYDYTRFTTIEEAKEAAKFPFTLSVYDGHYKGGNVWINCDTMETITTKTTETVEIVNG